MFDFDATLPLMALQFLVLTVVLNAVFYKPLTKTLDERDDYIRNTQKGAQERLAKAEKMAHEYEQKLGESRKQSQAIIVAAQADAQKIASEKVAGAQKEAQVSREQAAKEIDRQKQEAMRSLEQEVEALSRQILEKLLGPALAK
ncbi:F0F1 ATP synthase subunit B' [Kamptonema animale CS-326]|uniref:F0F1 ATP synthase subunit B' n=1 Tax=Kamptonema animale TaxID=92934 RepID=UPI0023314B6B|nr:F0F1 ATP synthase subunit B' [Kamptonema animale]MDB9514199.1 F0F1 ATP synthase subunit B' [Kamptonema animale CS-326]